MLSSRDPKSKVKLSDLQRSGDEKGHELNYLGQNFRFRKETGGHYLSGYYWILSTNERLVNGTHCKTP